MKKNLQSVIIGLFFLTCISLFSGCQYVTKEVQYITQQASEKTKTFDVKVMSLSTKQVPIRKVVDDSIADALYLRLCFIEGKEEIPYIALDSEILNLLYAPQESENLTVYEVSEISADTTQITLKNKCFNTSAVFDLTKHTLTFDNYDAFFQRMVSESKKEPVYFDVTDCIYNPSYLRINENECTNVPGQRFVVDWSNLNIDVGLWNDDGTYNLVIPLQTFSDIFFTKLNNSIVYNGKNIYLNNDLGNINLLIEFYQTANTSSPRSQVLSDFCYNELCLSLDINYGLKSIHGLDAYSDFDSFFTHTGIKKGLTDVDPFNFATALKDVISLYFDDGHSSFYMVSYFLNPNTEIKGNYPSKMGDKYFENMKKYTNARKTKIGDNIPAWEVSSDGKTAIVRFDSFTYNAIEKEYIKPIDKDEVLEKYVSALENDYDTVALIHTVNQKIRKYDKDHPDAKIQNVVLDLSCNGGGAVFSAAFILSWMLGEGTLHIQNQLTGAKWTTVYQADVNMDGEFNEQDTIKDKKLFCLISPVSFSCGNLVPAMLKDSGAVTILGVASSGGSCSVDPLSTADGTRFNLSSKDRISSRNNGSFYDIDRGIEPHIFINNPSNFYNVEYINNLIK